MRNFHPGDKVTFVTVYKKEHGIVKSVSDENNTFVVYNCGGEWDNYQEYTAALTRNIDLVHGWIVLEEKTIKDVNDELMPCICGSLAHYEDVSKNKNGHRGTTYARIVCDKNNSFLTPSDRCFMKTVCGPIEEVTRSWNTRPELEAGEYYQENPAKPPTTTTKEVLRNGYSKKK